LDSASLALEISTEITIAMTQTQQHRKYPCPSCGSTLEFNPKAERLKCPYCGREEEMPQSIEQVQEHSYEEYLTLDRSEVSILSAKAMEVSCPGCNSRITFEPPSVSGNCPFCATPIVGQPKEADPTLTPQAILPFKVDRKKARDSLQTWIGNLWFAPNGLKKLAQPEGIQGVYLPFWTYDSYTRSHYRGERGEHYYVNETYSERNEKGELVTKTRSVQKTRWYSASGHVERFFDDVLVCASQSIQAARIKALWAMAPADQLCSYDPSYLSGFKAQRYQIALKEGFEIAKEDMARVIREDVRHDIGGDEQRIHQVSTTYSAITFKHILLPVWLSAYRYNNKQYQVMINGLTGRVMGDRPYSIWKITAAVLAALALVAGIYFLIQSGENEDGSYDNPPPIEAPQ
jgi:DNA-directed RNA polymerase subunit RPC12/RpoP